MRKIAYSSEIFKVEEYNDRKRPYKKFYRILSPDSVAILPIRAGKVLLERQYRYSIGRYLYEAPAGYINKGEKPSTAARRELAEETGYVAGSIKFLFKAYVAPGSKTETCHYFSAEGIKSNEGTNFDENEIITSEWVGIDKALKMIKEGRIIDLKTIAVILYHLRFNRK